VRARLSVVTNGEAKAEWAIIDGGPARDLSLGASVQVPLKVTVPAGVAAGTYSLRLDVIADDRPEEDFARGPELTVQVAPSTAKKPFPWWIVAVAAAVLVICGVLVYVLSSGSKPAPAFSVVSRGQTTLGLGGSFSFDSGTEGGGVAVGDVAWVRGASFFAPGEIFCSLEPVNGAQIANLGVITGTPVSPQQLPAEPYSSTPITGRLSLTTTVIPFALSTPGDELAVHTHGGNYALVEITAPPIGTGLPIKWVTYRLPA
jgi:hypothetical protein